MASRGRRAVLRLPGLSFLRVGVNDMLTAKQQRFVSAYDGNATRAAIEAGYGERWAASNIDKLLKNTEIQAAIREREEKRVNSLILSREERQIFWSNVVRDPDEDMKNRLKASELLGRSEGDYLERFTNETPMPPVIDIHFIRADTALDS